MTGILTAAIDRKILQQIDAIRAEHHACTAGAIANQLDSSKAWIVQRCEILRQQGLIDWTRFPGSLHRVDGSPEPVLDPWDAPVGEPAPEPVLHPLDPAAVPRRVLIGFTYLDDEVLEQMSPLERQRYAGAKGAATARTNYAEAKAAWAAEHGPEPLPDTSWRQMRKPIREPKPKPVRERTPAQKANDERLAQMGRDRFKREHADAAAPDVGS